MPVCVWVGENGVDCGVEGEEECEDGSVGSGADGGVGCVCGGGGRGDCEGHQWGAEGGLRGMDGLVFMMEGRTDGYVACMHALRSSETSLRHGFRRGLKHDQ